MQENIFATVLINIYFFSLYFIECHKTKLNFSWLYIIWWASYVVLAKRWTSIDYIVKTEVFSDLSMPETNAALNHVT